ncbi:HEAT repeat domain-containing protein [Streptomyces sp. NPDC093064]|uniref:HEAT repeat domain-containing protein n=1 Tax=Streptomyces sp. NPDC093064 TaxID=3366020 RepID=UPI0037FAA439
MINDLNSVDWSSMSHAYGPAVDVPVWLRAMNSPDPEVRKKALGDFYSAAHHQGDVYPCTAASLPFLFDMADDLTAPDRASIVELLLSIGREALDRGEGIHVAPDGTESTAGADSAALMREHADSFFAYASDPDPQVRRAAIEGLGLFVDDADRAVATLRDRLPVENGIAERLLVVQTMADLALRLPAARASVTALLDTLAGETTGNPDIRLAALVHRARCAPAHITEGTVTTAIGLLRKLTPALPPGAGDEGRRAGSGSCACTADAGSAAVEDVPPQIAAAFAGLERSNRVHAPTTPLLRPFHAILGARLSERTALLTEQLRSPDPATRYDAIRMAQELITSWRGDHTDLVLLLAECLLPEDPYTSAAAGEGLGSLVPVSEPAREALAAYVTAHGPDVWATPKPLLRRAHQEAVMALARLADVRALPSMLTALDTDVDAWRAVQVSRHLRAAAADLVPRLSRRLAKADFSGQWPDMSTAALMSALAALGDPAAIPQLTDAVSTAVRHEQWRTATSALEALASFGTRAAPALEVVRPLTNAAEDVDLRAAATAAVWELERDPAAVMPLLEDLLDSYRHHEAADVLGRIGPEAKAVLPRLRQMLDAGYEWTRAFAAAALWNIGGEAEAGVVVPTLLTAWEENDATSNHVLACLNRMGPAAAPTLPRLRAELALPRRSGRFQSIANDEELQRDCRAILTRLS